MCSLFSKDLYPIYIILKLSIITFSNHINRKICRHSDFKRGIGLTVIIPGSNKQYGEYTALKAQSS